MQNWEGPNADYSCSNYLELGYSVWSMSQQLDIIRSLFKKQRISGSTQYWIRITFSQGPDNMYIKVWKALDIRVFRKLGKCMQKRMWKVWEMKDFDSGRIDCTRAFLRISFSFLLSFLSFFFFPSFFPSFPPSFLSFFHLFHFVGGVGKRDNEKLLEIDLKDCLV